MKRKQLQVSAAAGLLALLMLMASTLPTSAAEGPAPPGYSVAVKAGGGTNLATGKPWSKERAWEWYNARPWINGCNYLPSYAGNSTEFWQDDTFNPALIDKELTLAESLGYNSVRILMQYLVWENHPDPTNRISAISFKLPPGMDSR